MLCASTLACSRTCEARSCGIANPINRRWAGAYQLALVGRGGLSASAGSATMSGCTRARRGRPCFHSLRRCEAAVTPPHRTADPPRAIAQGQRGLFVHCGTREGLLRGRTLASNTLTNLTFHRAERGIERHKRRQSTAESEGVQQVCIGHQFTRLSRQDSHVQTQKYTRARRRMRSDDHWRAHRHALRTPTERG